jgi:hypothetical protein
VILGYVNFEFLGLSVAKYHQISHAQVTEAVFVLDADVWEVKYNYDHKFDPTIVTRLNGQVVDIPPLIKYDHLGVLQKPKSTNFMDDNPLFSFSTIEPNFVFRWLGLSTHRFPVSTSQARSWLWQAWKDNSQYDGVIVRWLDERLMRRNQVLKPYWRKRDWGLLDSAEAYLTQNSDSVIATSDLDSTISVWTPLAIKINDLYAFGLGGDASSRTRANYVSNQENDGALHVLAIDTGTWPNEVST